jgi:hypothetical protein
VSSVTARRAHSVPARPGIAIALKVIEPSTMTWRSLTLRPLAVTSATTWTLVQTMPLAKRRRLTRSVGCGIVAAVLLRWGAAIAGSGVAPDAFDGAEPTLGFEAQGQGELAFVSRGKNLLVWASATECRLHVRHAAGETREPVTIRPIGADPHMELRPREPLPSRQGRRPGLDYSEIEYRGVYPGIDLRLTREGSALKLSFFVDRGANPAVIRLASSENGSFATTAAWLNHVGLRAYQDDGRHRAAVTATTLVDGRGNLGFEMGPYDVRQPVVIESLLGGEAGGIL